ncbi:MAG: hypothetical protein AAGC95_15905 [Pseudomonadota bacterium]
MHANSRLTSEDYARLASVLINRHGTGAVIWADKCIEDLDAKGETRRASAWRALRVFITHQIGERPRRTAMAPVH